MCKINPAKISAASNLLLLYEVQEFQLFISKHEIWMRPTVYSDRNLMNVIKVYLINLDVVTVGLTGYRQQKPG